MRSGLFRIMRTLTAKEMKSFERFLASPYHRAEKNCLPLYELLKKNYPKFREDEIDYEKIYSELYPGKEYKKQVVWNLISALEKYALSFLEHEALKKDEFQSREMRINELLHRKLSNDALSELNGIEDFFKGRLIDFNYFRQRIRQGDNRINFYQAENKNHLLPDIYIESMEYRILSFFKDLKASLEDQQFFVEMYNKKYKFNLPEKLAKSIDLERIIEYCEENKFEYLYYIRIIFHSIMIILKNDEPEHFFKLRDLFNENHHRFDKREKRNMIIPIVNYCVRHRYSREHDYKRIMFELNEFRLSEGLAFYPGNQIPKLLYTQILLNAISLNELSWSREFVAKYTEMLHPDLRSSIGSLALAFLSFEDKKYNDVLRNLNEVNYTDVRDKIHVRMLTAKTYYELNENETLLNYIDSSRHFLQNNSSINESRKKQYGGLLNNLSQLVNLRLRRDPESINNFRNSVLNSEQNENVSWILKKADELI